MHNESMIVSASDQQAWDVLGVEDVAERFPMLTGRWHILALVPHDLWRFLSGVVRIGDVLGGEYGSSMEIAIQGCQVIRGPVAEQERKQPQLRLPQRHHTGNELARAEMRHINRFAVRLQMAVSQILMAIYEEDFLADVLDRWFEEEVRKGNQGRCELCRFADDFVACFEYRHEAVAFERALKERLAEFGLEVAEEKTHRDLSDGVLLAESEESTPEFQLAELQPTATPF